MMRSFFAQDVWRRKAINLSYDYPDDVRLESKGLHLSKLEVLLPAQGFGFIIDSYPYLSNLASRRSARFSVEDKKFYINLSNIKINLTTAEEVFIVHEVFHACTYDFVTRGQFVVMDIGMNVGIASLYFAKRQDVAMVYSYEPFCRTFQQGMQNLLANPDLSAKIRSYNYGLSDSDQTLTVDYDYANKGQVGIHGTSLILGEVTLTDRETITLKTASSEVQRILAMHPGESLVLKIDCEGAEYGIIQDLFDNGLLRDVKVILMEWHEKGPEMLRNLLLSSGFSVFVQQATTKNVGMLYAAR